MIVFAFDRDLTVDSSPDPGPIPLAWVRFLAHETACEVWAIGNQALKAEADIPGLDELRERLGIEHKAPVFKERNNALSKRDRNIAGKHKRLRYVEQAFPGATLICIDDYPIGIEPWIYSTPEAFVMWWPIIKDYV